MSVIFLWEAEFDELILAVLFFKRVFPCVNDVHIVKSPELLPYTWYSSMLVDSWIVAMISEVF
jgi:hypothetical protein